MDTNTGANARDGHSFVRDSFTAVLRGRRSIRRFQDQPVSAATVRELIDCARQAPSDTNSQTWEFIAVLNQPIIQEISAATWARLREVADNALQEGLGKEARLLLKSFAPYATAFEHAPALIVVLSIPYTSKFREKIFDPLHLVPNNVWEIEGLKSSCLAAENLMLSAHAMGLGTCPMTGPILLAEKSMRKILSIKDQHQLNMVIALGYPSEQPSQPKRKDVDEILRIVY